MAARAILMRLLSAGPSPVDICDRVVAPALVGIVGEHWVNGTLSILEEHIISASTLDGLSMLTDKMPRGERRPHRALCAPYEGDVHDIGARMTALALESIGWSAAASGYCARSKKSAAMSRSTDPDLVCLSMTYAPTDQDRRGAFEKTTGNLPHQRGASSPGRARCGRSWRNVVRLAAPAWPGWCAGSRGRA